MKNLSSTLPQGFNVNKIKELYGLNEVTEKLNQLTQILSKC